LLSNHFILIKAGNCVLLPYRRRSHTGQGRI